jgi:superfamily II DNA or RNA helicase
LLGWVDWVYAVGNRELAVQAEKELRETDVAVREIVGDGPRLQLRAMTYAGLDGLDVDGLLIDECHNLVPRTRSIPYTGAKSTFRIGMSGTPLDRAQGNAVLVGLIGPIVYSVGVADLIADGALANGCIQYLT